MRNLLAILILALLLSSDHGARAAPPDVAAKPKPPPMVIINKQDGSTLRGQIVSINPFQINFQPAAKPTQPANTVVDPIDIPWTQIKTISSGLTRAKAVQQYKIDHNHQLCETCHGEGGVFCSTCKGTAHDPAGLKDCKTCGGELLVDCKAPKCKQGQINCPMPCLKLSEGQWVMQDGHRVKLLHSAKGTGWISEGHVGQLVTIDPQTGGPLNGGDCPLCNRKTTVDCPVCHGSAKAPCATCVARKDVAACADCDHGVIACATCTGSGLKPQ